MKNAPRCRGFFVLFFLGCEEEGQRSSQMGGTGKRWRSAGKSAGEKEGKSACPSRRGGEMLSHFSVFGKKWIDSMTPLSLLASADTKKSLK